MIVKFLYLEKHENHWLSTNIGVAIWLSSPEATSFPKLASHPSMLITSPNWPFCSMHCMKTNYRSSYYWYSDMSPLTLKATISWTPPPIRELSVSSKDGEDLTNNLGQINKLCTVTKCNSPLGKNKSDIVAPLGQWAKGPSNTWVHFQDNLDQMHTSHPSTWIATMTV